MIFILYFLKERIIFLGTPIDDQVANAIIAQLLFLRREDPEKEIQMYINSPGGPNLRGFSHLRYHADAAQPHQYCHRGCNRFLWHRAF